MKNSVKKRLVTRTRSGVKNPVTELSRSNMSQPPLRNPSTAGIGVYMHSGEFSPRIADFAVASRGISFELLRVYSSRLCMQAGPFGLGWTFSFSKNLTAGEGGIVYHDGFHRAHLFKRASARRCVSEQLYGYLDIESDRILFLQPRGVSFSFETLEEGGRLTAIGDRTGTLLEFNHKSGSTQILDSFSRRFMITYSHNLITRVSDHLGKTWNYEYDRDGCLIAVIPPEDSGLPNLRSVRYGYDGLSRLISAVGTDNLVLLRNTYDEKGRVVLQEAQGKTFSFRYGSKATKTGSGLCRTSLLLPNGAQLNVEHGPNGQMVRKRVSLKVGQLHLENKSKSSKEISLEVSYKYNKFGELIEQMSPSGDLIRYVFDERNARLLDRGNLLAMKLIKSHKETETFEYLYTRDNLLAFVGSRLGSTKLRYDDAGRIVRIASVQGGRKEIESYEYNSLGQIVRRVGSNGVVTTYHYSTRRRNPSEPSNARMPKGRTSDNFLRRVTQEGSRSRFIKKRTPAVLEIESDCYGYVTAISLPKPNNKPVGMRKSLIGLNYFNGAGNRTAGLTEGDSISFSGEIGHIFGLSRLADNMVVFPDRQKYAGPEPRDVSGSSTTGSGPSTLNGVIRSLNIVGDVLIVTGWITIAVAAIPPLTPEAGAVGGAEVAAGKGLKSVAGIIRDFQTPQFLQNPAASSNSSAIPTASDDSKVSFSSPQTSITSNGVIVTKYPDGTVEYDYPNGTTVLVDPNGNTSITASSGDTLIYNDGSSISTSPGGPTVIVNSDGSVEIEASNGTTTSINADGSVTMVLQDGTTVDFNSDGSVSLTDSNGETNTTDATYWIVNSDGSVTAQDANGTTTTYNTDGTNT